MARGTGVSTGIGFAQAILWQAAKPSKTLTRKTNTPHQELQRFMRALKRVMDKNEAVRQKTARRFGDSEAAIFDAYHMMLSDDEGLINPVRENIEVRCFTAEYAISSQFNIIAQQFLTMDSEYLRQRAEDIYSLRDQLMRELHGAKSTDASHLDAPTIVIAHSLSPVDIANMDLSRLEGLVCETGGYTSHIAIMARTLGIPAITGAREILGTVHNGDIVALDGESGEVWVNPGKQELDYLRARGTGFSRKKELAQLYRGLPTITTDGHRVELAANISRLADADRALESDAECIGMFRTEILHFNRMPMADEEAQFMAYRSLLEKMGGKAVTVRIFDDGGNHPTLPIKGAGPEENPVMGYRGIRMNLGRRGFFRTQLRAILRASAYGPIKILLPMVSMLEELEETTALLDDVKLELQREQHAYDSGVPVGLLVETPATAIMAGQFAAMVDFFTISLPSLLQFTLGVDRNNAALSYLYHLCHPALLHLLQSVIVTVHAQGIPCYIAGEVPDYEHALPLLLGMGMDGFAMSPMRVLHARRILNSITYAECYHLAQQALELRHAADLRDLLAEFAQRYFPEPRSEPFPSPMPMPPLPVAE